MKGRGLWLLFFLCWTWSVPAQNQSVLQQLLQTKGLKQAAVGISVRAVADGRKVLEYCPDMALTPASVMKLLPSWLALREKGEKYQFRTPVYYSGELKDGVLAGNIIVVSQGDPTLDSRYFPKRSWPWEDVSNYYAALYLPFNYKDNTFTLQFRSGEAGKPVELISVTPFLPGTEVRNEVIAATDKRDNAWIFGGPYSPVLYVKGTIPANHAVFRVKGAMHDPAAVFVSELETVLLKNNICVEQKEITSGERYELLSVGSPSLGEIVFHTNKSSVNLFAEALGCLAAGDDWSVRVEETLKQAGVDASGMVLKDACGLSPMNAIPARVFTDLLVNVGQQRQTALLNSLPQAGADGGLAGYCHASPELKNRLKAKTGSMAGVRCLAGFVTRKSGEQLAFTILINHYTCTTAELQRAVGKFLNSFL